MLVATVLAALLIAGDLAVNSRLSRDRALIDRQPLHTSTGLRDLLSRDLQQAESVDSPNTDQLILIGHGSIYRATMLPDQRWTKVSYQLVRDGASSNLWRTQEYLDEPARPQRWSEQVAHDVGSWSLSSQRITIELPTGGVSVERGR